MSRKSAKLIANSPYACYVMVWVIPIAQWPNGCSWFSSSRSICQLCFQTTCSARLGKAKPGNALLLTTEDDIRGASLRGRDQGALMKRSRSPVEEDFVDEERPTFKINQEVRQSLFFIAIVLFLARRQSKGSWQLDF